MVVEFDGGSHGYQVSLEGAQLGVFNIGRNLYDDHRGQYSKKDDHDE
jgi:hypothetical protein